MGQKTLKRARRKFGVSAGTSATAFLLVLATMALPVQARNQKTSATTLREVTDETGRVVKLPAQIGRIVSLAPSLTETVYALGLQDKLVGVTEYCDYPPDAVKKHKVGGAINPNMEEIAALKPDVVLVVKSLNRLETVHALEQLGIPVYGTDPHNASGILYSIERLAEVLGAKDAGAALHKKLDARIGAVHEKLKGVPPKRVMFVVWTEPLMSVGRKTFLADVIEQAGGFSVVDSHQDWPQFSLAEAVRF